MYEYSALLIRVIDADTFEMNIDLGFYVHDFAKIRLRGANAPERFTPEGKLATEYVKNWFTLYAPLGCVLKTYKTDLTDKYGRWVADVISKDGLISRNLASDLIATGHAVYEAP